jgi:hypothetical protein
MTDSIASVATPHETLITTGVPIEVLEALLRVHVADQTAVITDLTSTPFQHQGTNDSTSFFRVAFTWSTATHSERSRTAIWVVKHWKAGGVRDRSLGITQPREVLAWEHGWLRPSALPDGVVVPFIGARRSPDNTEAWLAMADVSTELGAYTRMSLSADQMIGRAQAILAKLARFHAIWEHPEQQIELRRQRWLPRPETYLWDLAPTYARALGRTPLAARPGVNAPPVWDGLRADLNAFLEARPTDEARLWQRLLLNRHDLVEGLAAYPQTLLHHDLDDRNIGLRWPSNGTAGGSAELVMIDWEWMALGPAAIDVATIVQFLPVMIGPGNSIPESIWADELAKAYFAHYRAAGGRLVDPVGWRRSYGLALVAQGVSQMPFLHGSLRRAIRGDIPLPQIVGVPEAVIRQNLQAGLPTMERMEQRVIGEARRWLSLV